MKSIYFEEDFNRIGLPKSGVFTRYNKIPQDLTESQVDFCRGCFYRISKVVEEIAMNWDKPKTEEEKNDCVLIRARLNYTPKCNSRYCSVGLELITEKN